MSDTVNVPAITTDAAHRVIAAAAARATGIGLPRRTCKGAALLSSQVALA